MNDYERTRHTYDMRVLNDENELELIKQMKIEQREQANQRFNSNYAVTERELKVIQSETKKSVAEIGEKTATEIKRIEAESELKAQLIRAETQVMQAKLMATGNAQAQTVKVEAENYCELKVAEQMKEVAVFNAEVLKVEGKTEQELAKVLQSRRQFEYLNAKLDTVAAMSGNAKVKIFGN